MTTFAELRKILDEITDGQPEGVGFLEDSRERERAYSRSSTHRWLEIVHKLEETRPKRCLDIGTSAFTFALKHWCSTVETVDFTDHFRTRCDPAGITLHLAGEGEWLSTIPDEAYDCIIFLEVIEHLHMNPEKILSILRNKLLDGGRLIMSTPNLMCFGNRLRMMLNLKLNHFHYPPFKPVGLHGHGHDRVYTPPEMNDYLKNTGWRSFELGYHGMAVSDSIQFYPFGKKILHLPGQIVKRAIPSTRQLMLVTAIK